MLTSLPNLRFVAPVTVKFTAAAGLITESPVSTSVVPLPSSSREATVELISSVTVGTIICDVEPICTLLLEVGTPPDQCVPSLQNPFGGGLFHVSVCANVADAHARRASTAASAPTIRSISEPRPCFSLGGGVGFFPVCD